MSNTVTVVVPYGPLRPRTQYQVADTGYDWVRVKHGGGLIYVPMNALASEWDLERMEREAARKAREEEEREDSDFEYEYN